MVAAVLALMMTGLFQQAHAAVQWTVAREIVSTQLAQGNNDAIVGVYYTHGKGSRVVKKIYAYADADCKGFLNEDLACSTNLPEGESSAVTDRL